MTSQRQAFQRAPHGRRRSALRLMLLGVALSCVDKPTGPGSQLPARVTVRLALPASTPPAWRPPGDSLAITVRRAGLVAPIVAAESALGDSLVATVTVPLESALEGFVATAEVRSAGMTYFMAFDAVQLRAGMDTTLSLDARYVGPAAGAATIAVVAPRPSLQRGDTMTVTVVARDSAGQPITSAPVRFVATGAGTVDAGGRVVAADGSGNDSVRVSAYLPTGVSASARIYVTASSGGGLTGRQTIAFISTRPGTRALYIMEPDGAAPRRVTASQAAEYFPAYAPDQRSIAFERDVQGAHQIFTIAPDGTGERQLTTAGANTGPRWSPDGARIAFTSTRGGTGEVWVMNADGSGQRRLVDPAGGDDRFGDWSPDGARIVAIRRASAGSLAVPYTADSSGAGVTPLDFFGEFGRSAIAARWSPLGGALAFTTVRLDTAADLTTLVPWTGAPDDTLARVGTFTGYPAWSGSEHAFVFDARDGGPRGIYALDSTGAIVRLSPADTAEFEPDAAPVTPAMYVATIAIAPRQVGTTGDESVIGFSAGGVDARGRAVAVPIQFTAGDSRLTPLDSTRFAAIAVGRTAVVAAYLGWRADTATVDVASAAGASTETLVGAYGGTLYTMRGDGTAFTPLGLEGSDPSFSPDGARLAYRGSDPSGNLDVYVANADGTSPTRLTTDPAVDGQPSWSPDGTQIAFSSARSGRYHVYVMRADGTGLGQLTAGSGDDVDPAWSPDGSEILFVSGGALAAVSLADGRVRPLVDSAGVGLGGRYPAWAPDQSAIYWSAGSPTSVLRLALPARTRSALTTGTTTLPGGGSGDYMPSVSQGGLITFWSFRHNASFAQQMVMRADGSGISGLLPIDQVSGYAQWRRTTPPPYVATVVAAGTAPMVVGDTLRLTPSAHDQRGGAIIPIAGYSWRSLDPAVATVDSTGLVSAVSAGTARIELAAGIARPDTVSLVVSAAAAATAQQWVGGAAAQNVHIDNPGLTAQPSRFASVRIANAAGVTVDKGATVDGMLELVGAMTIPATMTVDVVGNLLLRAGSVSNDAGTLEYGGTCTDRGATITGNAPVPR